MLTRPNPIIMNDHPIMFTKRYFFITEMMTPAQSAKGVVTSDPGKASTDDLIGDAPKQVWKKTVRCMSVFMGEINGSDADLVDNISLLKRT